MKLRSLLVGFFATVFAVSTAMALFLAADYNAGDESYQKARMLVSRSQQAATSLPEAVLQETELKALGAEVREPDGPLLREIFPGKLVPGAHTEIVDSNAVLLAGVDLEVLREVNPQVIGWVFVPGTNIDYPIVQGENNQYYLEHTWDNLVSSVGAVFMEASNDPEFSDFSTILYAHNLRVGTMFSALHYYKNQEFWAENPYVYIVTDAEVQRYRIYAAYEADVGGTTYWQDVDSKLRRQEYVDYGLAHSLYDTGIVPTTKTPVLTLSTCTGYTYARRWVVQAILEGPVIPPQE